MRSFKERRSGNTRSICAINPAPAILSRASCEAHLNARNIEAMVNGVLIGCLYLPTGIPLPVEYKLRWFDRLLSYADELLSHDLPIALVGGLNVMRAELNVYAPERWRDDALIRPEVKKSFADLIN